MSPSKTLREIKFLKNCSIPSESGCDLLTLGFRTLKKHVKMQSQLMSHSKTPRKIETWNINLGIQNLEYETWNINLEYKPWNIKPGIRI